MIVHIDGDAFFASVYQATHPETKGKPVAIGRERGVATAISYEAKARGVRRGMLMHEIKKICPECIIASSNYHIYESFSRKIISITQKYSPAVERYSIDEVFAEVEDPHTALLIKKELEQSLNITVSVGVAATKCLAKIGSNFHKPSGYVVINPENRNDHLDKTPIGNVWGIGWRLTARMKSLGIQTALEFVTQPEVFIRGYFNKSILALWHELRGNRLYTINTGAKVTYKSIQKTQTHTPPTNNPKVLRAQLFDHIEKAFIKARRHNYRAGAIHIFLKTQKFSYKTTLIKLPEKIAYPFLIRPLIHKAFQRIFNPRDLYRATGCTLLNLEKLDCRQDNLFSPYKNMEERLKKFYPLIDQKKVVFGSALFEKHPILKHDHFQFVTVDNLVI